jgi:hypothetical protein
MDKGRGANGKWRMDNGEWIKDNGQWRTEKGGEIWHTDHTDIHRY